MDIWVLAILLAVIAVIVVLVVALRTMRPEAPRPVESYVAPAAAAAPMALPPEVAVQIDDQLRAGNKIAAIKILRDHTGVGLREAKTRIDHWAVGAAPATSAIPIVPPTFHDAPSLRATLPAETVAEIDRLLAAAQPIAAIKLLREETRLGLKESKDLIDAWHA